MNPVERSVALLEDTETKLRALVSEAASAGDYTNVVQITSWARTVHQLLNPVKNHAINASVNAPRTRTRRNQSAALLPYRPKQAYPQFFRQGEELTRLAWSRREKKEYRHKMPHSVLRALAKTMAEKGAEGRVFSTDEFLPIQDGAEGTVPNYQAYVGISLLKQTKLIDQHGRQGYSIPRLSRFFEDLEAAWKKLPELSS